METYYYALHGPTLHLMRFTSKVDRDDYILHHEESNHCMKIGDPYMIDVTDPNWSKCEDWEDCEEIQVGLST